MNIAYGCCVGSWDRFAAYVVPRSNGRVMGTAGQTSIAVAYNGILDAHRGQDLDALVLQHDDLEITDPRAEEKFMRALTGSDDVALLGVVGGSARGGLAWWNHDPIGHQLTDSMNIEHSVREGDVEMLEGSVLVFSRWAIEHLRFDASIVGFHGYDEIAMQALRRRKRVVVVDVDTHHHTGVGFDSKESHDDWLCADRYFREKWNIGTIESDSK